MQVLHLIIAASLCNNRKYLGGGDSVSKQLSQQFTCPYKECSERSFSYWPTAVRRGILDMRTGQKSPILSGLFSPHATQCPHPKLPYWKWLKCLHKLQINFKFFLHHLFSLADVCNQLDHFALMFKVPLIPECLTNTMVMEQHNLTSNLHRGASSSSLFANR